MTDHPLTDDIIWSMWSEGDRSALAEEKLARAAAAWQLKECVEELHRLLFVFGATGVINEEIIPTLVELFKSNMRPQEDNS